MVLAMTSRGDWKWHVWGGKAALITGSGIGLATARAVAAKGAKIIVAEINTAAGEQTAQIVSQAGDECIAILTDVSQEESVKTAIEAAVRNYGALHILHNNAGGSTPADNTAVESPIEEFWRAIRLDLFGTFLGVPLRHTGDHRLWWRSGDQHGLECRVDGRCRPRLNSEPRQQVLLCFSHDFAVACAGVSRPYRRTQRV
jgi:hypothetical protein